MRPSLAPGNRSQFRFERRTTHITSMAHRAFTPARGDRHGHPVIFDRAMFDELKSADLATGARAVIARHAADAVDVPVDDEGALADIDTPEDYRSLIGRLRIEH